MSRFDRRTLFRVHSWIGLNFGLLLFAVCFSGTVAVFGPELDWLADPAERVEPPALAERQKLSWQRLYQTVEHALPGAQILRLYAPNGPSFAARAVIAYDRRDFRRVLVDPYTYEIQGQRSTFTIRSFLRIFHKQLYIVPVIFGLHGILVVGPLGILLLVSVIAGLCAYRRWWRSFFSFRGGRSQRALWSDIHRVTGVWSLAIMLVFAVTGIWYLVEYAITKADIIVEDTGSVKLEAAAMQALPALGVPLDLDDAAGRAQQVYPQLKVQVVALPVRSGQTLTLMGEAEAWVVRSRANQVHLNPFTTEILHVRRGYELSVFERWIETADPLHFGTFGGTATRIVWLVVGLFSCAGILTGLVTAWLRLNRREATFPRRRLTALLAVLPSLVILAASAIGAAGYGYAQQARAQSDSARQFLDPVAVGPWTIAVSRDFTPGAKQGAIPVQIQFVGNRLPNISSVKAGLGLAGSDTGGRPFRLFGSRALGTISGAPEFCKEKCRLEISVQDRHGARYQTSVPMAGRFLDPAVGTIVPRNPVPDINPAAKSIIAIFSVLLLIPMAAWAYLRFRVSA